MANPDPPQENAPAEAPEENKPAVENRWWVDSGTKKEARGGAARQSAEPDGTGPIIGQLFFDVGIGFDQDKAQKQLTDSNLNLIKEANPSEGTWAYMCMIEDKSPPERLAKVKRMLRLPKWARGVLVDAGTSIRAIATGEPVGERIIELSIGSQSSFDAWAGGEWVREKVFRSRERALREGSGLIVRYLKNRDR
ncbi:MAG: hypothetical protein P8R42_14910 [Candidatus Binatia bacterium]|nr:hypothetical protein [Candidatus Binatia bacterium]